MFTCCLTRHCSGGKYLRMGSYILPYPYEQQQTSRGEPVVIVPGLMDNVLTLVSFLFLGCFFVLGLRIQSAERTRIGSTSQSSSSPTSSSSLIDKYFLLLILVSIIPAIIVIIYGIVLIGMYL